MRTIILTAVAAAAIGAPAMAQINAPNNNTIYPSGSLMWPRSDSFSFLRGHGIDKDLASDLVERAAPQGQHIQVDSLRGTLNPPPAPLAYVPLSTDVSARVPDFRPSSDWGAWRRHQYDCAITYPSYNPTTDMIMSADGGREFCQLSLGDSGIRF